MLPAALLRALNSSSSYLARHPVPYVCASPSPSLVGCPFPFLGRLLQAARMRAPPPERTKDSVSNSPPTHPEWRPACLPKLPSSCSSNSSYRCFFPSRTTRGSPSPSSLRHHTFSVGGHHWREGSTVQCVWPVAVRVSAAAAVSANRNWYRSDDRRHLSIGWLVRCLSLVATTAAAAAAAAAVNSRFTPI